MLLCEFYIYTWFLSQVWAIIGILSLVDLLDKTCELALETMIILRATASVISSIRSTSALVTLPRMNMKLHIADLTNKGQFNL